MIELRAVWMISDTYLLCQYSLTLLIVEREREILQHALVTLTFAYNLTHKSLLQFSLSNLFCNTDEGYGLMMNLLYHCVSSVFFLVASLDKFTSSSVFSSCASVREEKLQLFSSVRGQKVFVE